MSYLSRMNLYAGENARLRAENERLRALLTSNTVMLRLLIELLPEGKAQYVREQIVINTAALSPKES